MTITTKSLSRRALVTGVTLAVVTPALAAMPASIGITPISKLWAEAQSLASELASHRAAISEAASMGGIPGWMRLGGEANRIAEARYGKLVAILNTPAMTAGDLAILGKVSMDDDIANGARAWASERLASAAMSIAA